MSVNSRMSCCCSCIGNVEACIKLSTSVIGIRSVMLQDRERVCNLSKHHHFSQKVSMSAASEGRLDQL